MERIVILGGVSGVALLWYLFGIPTAPFVSGTVVALRNSATGNFLCSTSSGVNTSAENSSADNARWQVVNGGGGSIALMNVATGTYLSQTGGAVDVHDSSITSSSAWTPVSADPTDGSLAGLVNSTTGTFLNAAASGSVDLSATATGGSNYGAIWRMQNP